MSLHSSGLNLLDYAEMMLEFSPDVAASAKEGALTTNSTRAPLSPTRASASNARANGTSGSPPRKRLALEPAELTREWSESPTTESPTLNDAFYSSKNDQSIRIEGPLAHRRLEMDVNFSSSVLDVQGVPPKVNIHMEVAPPNCTRHAPKWIYEGALWPLDSDRSIRLRVYDGQESEARFISVKQHCDLETLRWALGVDERCVLKANDTDLNTDGAWERVKRQSLSSSAGIDVRIEACASDADSAFLDRFIVEEATQGRHIYSERRAFDIENDCEVVLRFYARTNHLVAQRRLAPGGDDMVRKADVHVPSTYALRVLDLQPNVAAIDSDEALDVVVVESFQCYLSSMVPDTTDSSADTGTDRREGGGGASSAPLNDMVCASHRERVEASSTPASERLNDGHELFDNLPTDSPLRRKVVPISMTPPPLVATRREEMAPNFVVTCIIESIRALHAMEWAHLGISTDAFVFSAADCRWKLADFGSALPFNSPLTVRRARRLAHAPPEVTQWLCAADTERRYRQAKSKMTHKKPRVTGAIDMYAVGVVIEQVFGNVTRAVSLPPPSSVDSFMSPPSSQQHASQTSPAPTPVGVRDPMRMLTRLSRRLTQGSASLRPSADEILKSDLFALSHALDIAQAHVTPGSAYTAAPRSPSTAKSGSATTVPTKNSAANHCQMSQMSPSHPLSIIESSTAKEEEVTSMSPSGPTVPASQLALRLMRSEPSRKRRLTETIRSSPYLRDLLLEDQQKRKK